MSQNNRPLSSHPAFRALVALWFAALLGFGTWVMPAGVFERAVAATGLAELIPAAAPPLGQTARLAISAAAALIGILLGLFIAGRVSRSETVETYDDDEIEVDAPAPVRIPDRLEGQRRRPLLVREELGDEFPSAVAADADLGTDEADADRWTDEDAGEDPLTTFVTVPGTQTDESTPDYDGPPLFGGDGFGEDEAEAEPIAFADLPGSDGIADPTTTDDLATLGARLEEARLDYRRRMAGTGSGWSAEPYSHSDPESGTEDGTQARELRRALEKLSQAGRES